MGLIIDIIVIAFILLSIFFGYKKGLVVLAVKLCAFVIAIVVTLVLYKPVANLVINSTSIDESIQNTILEKVTDIIEDDQNAEITNELIESAKQGMLPEASRELAINIIYAGVMIILFIGIRICLIFVTAIANVITKLPILNQINKLGGILYGLIRGILLVYVFLLIISIVGTVNPKNEVHKQINTSYITKAMYENNIISIIFK